MGLSISEDKSDVVNTSYVSTVKTVSTTEVEARVGGSPLADRQELIIYNDDSSITIFFGPTGVTTSGANKGIPIAPGEAQNIQIGPDLSVFMIAGSSNSNVIVQELA